MTHCVKAKFNKTHQNTKSTFWGEISEPINHILNRCSKLEQKEYKTGHGEVGKVINWELCKGLDFDHTNKWYIKKSESVVENVTHDIILDFEMQTNILIPTSRQDLVSLNKK